MLPSSSRELHSSEFGFATDGVTLVSYVLKRAKAVVLLSTQHRDKTVVADDNSKSEIISYYNATKSGVDVLDKLVRTYSVKRSTRRWTVAFFSTCWILLRTTHLSYGSRPIRTGTRANHT